MKREKKSKPSKAIALAYNESKDPAPKVTAKGDGLVANHIITRAKEHDVPIYEDSSLVELLSTLDINVTIPNELYEVVAEVFAFIYEVDRQYPKQ